MMNNVVGSQYVKEEEAIEGRMSVKRLLSEGDVQIAIPSLILVGGAPSFMLLSMVPLCVLP